MSGKSAMPEETQQARRSTDHLLFALDLAGTFVFAVEGALAAAHGGLDFFGLMVLAFITALGGGIIRDLLIGAAPPASLRDWRYGATALAGGTAVFFFHPFLAVVPPQLIMLLDAGGLALFAVAGAGKALSFQMHPFIAILMGGITGVGGGTIRDVLLMQIPTVLRADVYATAALAGAAVMVVGLRLNQSPRWMALLGALVCFTLRVVSVWLHWNLPKVTG
jgi:uncharacterized membrane protein YeiH